jgi:hypothetical protein
MKELNLFPMAALLILVSCANRPTFMQHEVVFYAKLGDQVNQLGSNIPILNAAAATNTDMIIDDYLDLPSSIQIFRNRVYIADKYNRRVSIFPLGGKATNNTPILSKGEGYEFGYPFQVLVNRYEEVFVLASATYNSNSLAQPDGDTNVNQYYIYKFSRDGKFIFTIGVNGIHTEAMPYPDRIDIDLFDNLYAYFKQVNTNNGSDSWLVKRYSSSGELNFEFQTKYLSPTNVIGDNTYIGRISDIYNLKNDERLLIYSENVIAKKKDQEVTVPDDFYLSLDVYSVLQNSITKNIFKSKKFIDGLVGVTDDDIVALYSYDDRWKGVRFRFVDILNKGKSSVEEYYAPLVTDPFRFGKYFIDSKGQIYATVLKDYDTFFIIRWKKVKSKVNG